jgi:hypothetical protein
MPSGRGRPSSVASTISSSTFVVSGYKKLIAASKFLVPAEKKEVRAAFARSGEIVRADAATRFRAYSAHSAAGYRVRVRQRGVEVDQSLKKTTGLHPEWGALQMRKALLPSLYAKQTEIEAEFEKALDEVTTVFNRA